MKINKCSYERYAKKKVQLLSIFAVKFKSLISGKIHIYMYHLEYVCTLSTKLYTLTLAHFLVVL